jgi:hypothetical protein
VKALDRTLTELHHGENRLARELVEVAQRHRTEHELHQVARQLAAWSAGHVARLAELGSSRGLSLDADADEPGALAGLRERAAELLGRREATGLLLLHDLRTLHLMATDTSVLWVLAAQGAQAARDSDLLSLVDDCHPQTLRQLRWTLDQLKVHSPQILTSLQD